jgi:pSer/pThr/pTyr-binding forkhead associated (FHA) protein
VATALPGAKQGPKTGDTDPGRRKAAAKPAPPPPLKRARSTQRQPTRKMKEVEEGERSSPVSIEYNTGPLARQTSHDTRQIVDPRAAPYLDNARQMSVARLVLKTEGKEDRSFPLSRDSSTLGRHRNNDIVISDPKVSSFHARIDRTTEGYLLVDLGSRNGSFVNGRRVTRHNLASGDELRVGTAKLSYQVDFTTPA